MVFYVGLERLQQLLDALTDAGDVLVQHVYRVVDADDAFQTLQRLSRHDETTKHILIDLPTPECEQLLHRQVTDLPRCYRRYKLNIVDLSCRLQSV